MFLRVSNDRLFICAGARQLSASVFMGPLSAEDVGCNPQKCPEAGNLFFIIYSQSEFQHI